MKKIRLFCAAGMSTSMLVKKMEEAAIKKDIDVSIVAYSISEMDTKIDECDIVLLGPQVGYQLKDAKALCDPKSIPVGVIPMVDYGMMNGDKVLDFALNLQ